MKDQQLVYISKEQWDDYLYSEDNEYFKLASERRLRVMLEDGETAIPVEVGERNHWALHPTEE